MGMFDEHFQRVQDAISNQTSLFNLSSWIEKHTTLEMRPYSFLGREYQKDVIDHPAKELYVVKCAQVGLSEIFARWSLAAACTQDNFTIITTFPNSTDAELFSKSRLEPVINGSKRLLASISSKVNSVELRQFGENSFIYTRGTKSETGALSVPADLVIHDEYDRSDMDNVAAYVSRLQAKPTKMRRLFSTPTVSKYGIDAAAEHSKRYKQMWRCNHCNHRFLPTYESDVHIPGWDREKKEITAFLLKDMRWREAKLLCPNCYKQPDSRLEYREWVCANPTDNYEAVSYFISPFCAPSFLTAPYLVEVSTRFKKWSEFKNQALGECAEDAEDTLTRTDLDKCNLQATLDSSEVHYLGADMGLVCHIMIGRMVDGMLLIVHREKVVYTQFEERRRVLCAQYRVVLSVHDMFPYTDIIARITSFDANAYGAVYVAKKSTETHTIKEQEEEPEEGKLNVRAAHVNREVAFDQLMQVIKAGQMRMSFMDEEVIAHLLSMKRVQKFDKFQTLSYVWVKTDGVDHFHHTLLYLYIACLLRGTISTTHDVSANPLVVAAKQTVLDPTANRTK